MIKSGMNAHKTGKCQCSLKLSVLLLLTPFMVIENRKFFNVDPPNKADSMGFPYEHKSLMHFSGFEYASGSNPTIVSKVPGMLLGNNKALTVQDVTMINQLYAQCKSKYWHCMP